MILYIYDKKGCEIHMLKNILKDESGQGLVEYGLILALVSVIAIAALKLLGDKVNKTLGDVNEALPAQVEPTLP